jgi:glycosyltransferase involved in cell wall biosynthesis
VTRDILVIYNLELDLDSHVLATAHDWVEELAHLYSQVIVFTTHVGRTSLPVNVRVIEIGGGNTLQRVRAVYRMLKSLEVLIQINQRVVVFHHMSTRSLLLVGLFLRLLRIPQILWYSHSVADLPLRICQLIPNLIVSSNAGTVPIANKRRIREIGHGINTARFGNEDDLLTRERQNIVALGRVVRVKNLEIILETLLALDSNTRSELGELKVIGPNGLDLDYEYKLIAFASAHSLKMRIMESLDYSSIPELLASSSMLFSGTPKSVDKVCLEAAMSGCFIISNNENVLDLTGMNEIYPKESIKKNVKLQIDWISNLSIRESTEARKEIMRLSRNRNSLTSLARRIRSLFEEIEGLQTGKNK